MMTSWLRGTQNMRLERSWTGVHKSMMWSACAEKEFRGRLLGGKPLEQADEPDPIHESTIGGVLLESMDYQIGTTTLPR